MFGDDPEQGVVRGHSYLHRGLRFAFDFPDGWHVESGQTQVVAREPGGPSLMILQSMQLAPGRTIEEVAVRSMQSAGFGAVEGSETTVDGLPAYIGRYTGSMTDLGPVEVSGAHILHHREVIMAAGIAPVDIYPSVEAAFEKSLRSFRALSAGEAEGVRPNRIELYTVREGDTWQSIAEREGKGRVKATTLAIMNGHAVSDQPQPGERLKIVTSG